MLAQSQGRNEQVVNSYNLFIDSAKDVGGAAGKGDSFSLQLGADSIQAQDGQFLRLTLQEFSMYTNFYMVNINNCTDLRHLAAHGTARCSARGTQEF